MEWKGGKSNTFMMTPSFFCSAERIGAFPIPQFTRTRSMRFHGVRELREEFPVNLELFYKSSLGVVNMSKGQAWHTKTLMEGGVLIRYWHLNENSIFIRARETIEEWGHGFACLAPCRVKPNHHELIRLVSHHFLVLCKCANHSHVRVPRRVCPRLSPCFWRNQLPHAILEVRHLRRLHRRPRRFEDGTAHARRCRGLLTGGPSLSGWVRRGWR